MTSKKTKSTTKQKQAAPMADDLQIDPKMLQLLVCPLTKQSLEFDPKKSELKSVAARLAYPIRGGIPILLPSEARALDDREVQK